MILFDIKRRCMSPMGGRAQFGGDSESSQSSENTDMRVVGGDESFNFSQKVSGSNNVVTTTDHGAVKGGTELALRGVELANQTTQQVVASSGGLLDGALRMVGDQQKQFVSTIENLKGNDVRVLVIAGLGVVAIAVVFAFKKG